MPNKNTTASPESFTLITHIITTMSRLRNESDDGCHDRNRMQDSIEELFQRGIAETIMLHQLIPNFVSQSWRREIIDVAESRGHIEILDVFLDLGLWQPTPHDIDIFLDLIVTNVECALVITEEQRNNDRKTCLWYVTHGFLLLADLPPELGLN